MWRAGPLRLVNTRTYHSYGVFNLGLWLGYKHLTPTESGGHSKLAQKSFMESRCKLHQISGS